MLLDGIRMIEEEIKIYEGVIITEKKAFTDHIWYEFVFSNSFRGTEKEARGCYWMILE